MICRRDGELRLSRERKGRTREQNSLETRFCLEPFAPSVPLRFKNSLTKTPQKWFPCFIGFPCFTTESIVLMFIHTYRCTDKLFDTTLYHSGLESRANGDETSSESRANGDETKVDVATMGAGDKYWPCGVSCVCACVRGEGGWRPGRLCQGGLVDVTTAYGLRGRIS